jgi:serine/threonine protein kinase
LSAGGFGITYLAQDFQFDDTCVVKELAMGEIAGRDTMTGALEPLPGREQDVAYWVDKVVREARLLNRIRHEAVVSVRAVWQERGTAYYAMDHIDGVEFPSGREEGWTWAHCEPLFCRMLEGLRAIHAAGLVHSDIKPSNILVKRDGQPVFIDFGTARTGEEMGKTRLTTVAFTPGYAPPELESKDRGKEVGPWSDLYSLAMVFIGLFATHPGLEGSPLESRMRETLARHSAGADPYNEGVRATMVSNGMSKLWADLLMACISVDPAGRPQSVDDFFARLRTASNRALKATRISTEASIASSVQPAAAEPGFRMPAPARMSTVAYAVVISVFLIVLTVIVVVFSGDDSGADAGFAPAPNADAWRPAGDTASDWRTVREN